MGSLARMERCSRFVKKFEGALLKRVAAHIGDFLEVQKIYFSRSEGDDLVRIFFVVRVGRTGDQLELEGDSCYFDPEERAEDCIDRLTGILRDCTESEKQYIALRKRVIKMLKSANLIDESYKEGK